ncbi:MAG: hypothetical protein O7C75_14560 [Verrucomicrobia bacterium]|nr:hypothetical protein [Verrucomicrobiota bacterium]
MSEYFIRYPDSEEAKGPYNIEQLQSLSEAKKVTNDTLYYDDDKEVWLAIRGNEGLTESLFPAEKKLSLKKNPDEELNLLKKPEEEEDKKLTVEDILAAAEGDTPETKNKRTKAKWKHRTIGYTIFSLAITFLLSGAGLAVLHLSTIQTLNPALILKDPFIITATIDLLLALCLLLSVTTIYPVVRFRAVLGLGFMAIYFYSFDQVTMAVLISVSMICAFINTFTTRVSVFMLTGPGSIGGMLLFLFLYYLYLNPSQA